MTPDEMQWQRHVDRHIRDRAEHARSGLRFAAEPLADRARMSVPTLVADGVAFDASGHKPGFRAADQAAQDAASAAYSEMVRRNEGAWRSPQRVEQDTETAAGIGRDAAAFAQDDRAVIDAAWHAYCDRIANAWKTA